MTPGRRPLQGARLDLEYEDIKSGFAVGKAAAISDWAFRKEVRDFKVLVDRLRMSQWQRENPEKKAAKDRRWRRKPGVVAAILAKAKERRAARHRAEGKVFTCQLDYCGAQFCRVPGSRGPAMHPRFCRETHYQTWKKREKNKGAKDQKTCSVCGAKGHNRRGCVVAARAA